MRGGHVRRRETMIAAGLSLPPVKVSGEPVNMAASVSCGS